MNNVVIFLSAHGINRLLKKSEYPKFAEKAVVYYEAEQVKALYAAARNDEERFTLDYFLKSGVRDGEAAHAEYSDVKSGFLKHRGQAAPQVRSLKHWHIRRIPIPQDLIVAIAERQKQNPACKLIFPKIVRGTPMSTCSASCSESQNVLAVHSTQTCTRSGGPPTRRCFQARQRFRPFNTCWVTKTSRLRCAIWGIADLNSPETRAAVEKTFSEFKNAQIDDRSTYQAQ